MVKKTDRIFTNIKALFNYPGISSKLSRKRNLYFFFPYWSMGGGERVHIDILSLFKDQDPLCFITERSPNAAFRKEFEAVSSVINLGRWAEKKGYKNHILNKIAKTINQQDNPVVFGCNSRFMYSLIPLLEKQVKIIDLLHSFSEEKEGAEWHSLPYVSRIDTRIVLGRKIIDQFRDLYKLNNIPLSYLDRLTIIQNKIDLNQELPGKGYHNRLRILFVARNSPEKRPGIFLKIAELCSEIKLPADFYMIGDFGSWKDKAPSNVEILGEIHEKAELKEQYVKAHLLLLTSNREGLPLVVLESMNSGVVPVCTNVGELSDYISPEKENGILIESSGDEDQTAALFVKEIVKMNNDKARLRHFSENAFKMVKQHFSADKFSAAYQSVISGDHHKNTSPIENS
jgi:glycosyltransferase involved in cell wall biosynthesis